MTTTGAVAVSGPVGVATVATTCPFPIRPDAVYVVEGPLGGAVRQACPARASRRRTMRESGFRTASMPTALNDAVAPSGSVAETGSMCSETAGAPETVSA